MTGAVFYMLMLVTKAVLVTKLYITLRIVMAKLSINLLVKARKEYRVAYTEAYRSFCICLRIEI
jgi:hypothetical protein